MMKSPKRLVLGQAPFIFYAFYYFPPSYAVLCDSSMSGHQFALMFIITRMPIVILQVKREVGSSYIISMRTQKMDRKFWFKDICKILWFWYLSSSTMNVEGWLDIQYYLIAWNMTYNIFILNLHWLYVYDIVGFYYF